MKKFKICIVSEYAYNLLFPSRNCNSPSGGAEFQLVSLAKKFSEKGNTVSLITTGEKNYKANQLPFKLFIPFNLNFGGYSYLILFNYIKLLKILIKIDPDFIIQRGSSPIVCVLAVYAKLFRKKFIFSVSSDHNINNGLSIRSISEIRRLPYIFGIKNADYIVCQTNYQCSITKNKLRKTPLLIKNVYIPKIAGNNSIIIKKQGILWVGRLIESKQPETFLDLAKMIPDQEFIMIASPAIGNEEYFQKVKTLALEVKNLNFIGYVQHKDIHRYYQQTALFISTSNTEGFPNTFLEAWGSGNPIVSLKIDPDNVIMEHNLGFVASNFEELVEMTQFLIKNSELRQSLGNNALEYVMVEHNIDDIVRQYENLIFKEVYAKDPL